MYFIWISTFNFIRFYYFRIYYIHYIHILNIQKLCKFLVELGEMRFQTVERGTEYEDKSVRILQSWTWCIKVKTSKPKFER